MIGQNIEKIKIERNERGKSKMKVIENLNHFIRKPKKEKLFIARR